MRRFRFGALTGAVVIALTLTACGGSQGGCAAHVPIGPVPAATPIPVQPLPPNSGVSTTVDVRVDFTINANGTVSSERVQTSSGSSVVDRTALQIVEGTTFKTVDTDCSGAPVRQGSIDITFSPGF